MALGRTLGEIFGGLSEGIVEGVKLRELVAERQERGAERRDLMSLRREQMKLEAFGSLGQIFRLPRNLRAPFLDEFSRTMAGQGVQISPALVEAAKRADEGQGRAFSELAARMGVTLTPEQALEAFSDSKTFFDYLDRLGKLEGRKKAEEMMEGYFRKAPAAEPVGPPDIGMALGELGQPQPPPAPAPDLESEIDRLERLLGELPEEAPKGQRGAIEKRLERLHKERSVLRGETGGFTDDVEIGGKTVKLRFNAVGHAIAVLGKGASRYELRDFEDKTWLVEMRPGGQRIEVGPAKAAATVMTPERIHSALADAGWRPDMPGYSAAYLDVARQVGVQGIGIVGAGQMVRPPAPPARLGAPMAPSGAPVAPGAAPSPEPIRPLVEAPGTPEQMAHYIHKDTLQPPPAEMTLPGVRRSGEYVVVPPSFLPAMSQMRTTAALMDSIEEVIQSRDDLFPRLTGDANRDAKNVSLARLKYFKLASPLSPWSGTDPDVAQFASNLIAMPAAVRTFGDVGQVPLQEREITAQAVGMRASSKEAALRRLKNIRDLINSRLGSAGVRLKFRSRYGRPTAPASPDQAVKELGIGAD